MTVERRTDDIHPDKKEQVDLEQAYAKQMELSQYIEINETPEQLEARWNVPLDIPNYPIAIYYMTDIHFGAKKMDFFLLEKYLNIVMETPNMYAIVGGDGIHNMTSKGMPEEEFVPPAAQMKEFFRRVHRLDDNQKLGALVLGDHDKWSSDLREKYLEKIKAPIFPLDGGVLTIDLGKQVYEVGVIHSYSGRNKYNITNAGKDAMKEVFPSQDGVLIGHDHRMAGEIYHTEANRKHFVIQGGTFMKKHILNPGTPTGMTVMLWSDQSLIGIQPIEAAAFWLNEAAKNNH